MPPSAPQSTTLPRTDFFCEEQQFLPGMYADPQLGCKVGGAGWGLSERSVVGMRSGCLVRLCICLHVCGEFMYVFMYVCPWCTFSCTCVHYVRFHVRVSIMYVFMYVCPLCTFSCTCVHYVRFHVRVSIMHVFMYVCQLCTFQCVLSVLCIPIMTNVTGLMYPNCRPLMLAPRHDWPRHRTVTVLRSKVVQAMVA